MLIVPNFVQKWLLDEFEADFVEHSHENWLDYYHPGFIRFADEGPCF